MFSSFRRPSPSLVISCLALFVALGGTAVATTEAVSPYQKRCAAGAVRGIAYVTGTTQAGIQNVPNEFTSAAQYFGYRWNCSGAAVAVRRRDTGVFEVRFDRNIAGSAVVTGRAGAPLASSVQQLPDGSFRVHIGTFTLAGTVQPGDAPFMLVVT